MRVREALRTGDRGGRRLARFAGSVAPADLAVLRAVDARRFEAVAQRQAEMIRDRWWTARFPGTLAGTALGIAATTRDVALGALAAPTFDRREGEDETGIALLGYVLGREDRTEDPEWLADLVAYEYLTAVGLPRRAGKQVVDLALEARALPEGTRFLDNVPKKPAKDDLALARRVVVLPVEYPVGEIREALRAAQEVPELDASPGVIVFLVDEEGATEIHVPALGHDLLDVLGQGPVPPAAILDAFDPEDKRAAHGALSVLVEAGVVTGPLPPQPPEPEPTRKGKKKKASAQSAHGDAGAGPAASSKKSSKKKAPAKPDASGGHAAEPGAPKKAPAKKPAQPEARKPAAKPAATKTAAKPAKKSGQRR